MMTHTWHDEGHEMGAVQEVIHALALGASTDEALDLVVERVHTLLEATETMILLVQDGRLLLCAGRGIKGLHLPRRSFDGDSVEGWVVRHNTPLFVSDASRDPRFQDTSQRKSRITALAAVPILSAGTVLGVLEVGAEQPVDFASSASFLLTMADIVTLVTEQTEILDRSLARANEEYLRTIRHDLKSPLTAIWGYAQLLRRRATREERVADVQTATVIMEQAQRMTALLNATASTKEIGKGDELSAPTASKPDRSTRS